MLRNSNSCLSEPASRGKKKRKATQIVINIVMDKLLLLDPKPGDLTKTRL